MDHFDEWDKFGDKLRSLNTLQRQFFEHVMFSVHRDNAEPLHLFLTGGAGVGKTVIVFAITQAITRHFNYNVNVPVDTLRVLLLAPTGKAAFNISGTTVHSGLVVPINQRNHRVAPLSNSRLTELQFKYHTLKMLIVDEVSMLGLNMLMHLEARLRQIMNTSEVFGGLHVIFVG